MTDNQDQAIASDEQRAVVRERYASKATDAACCGANQPDDEVLRTAKQIGYSRDDVTAVPMEANLGLGCGNPTAIANLSDGETVLDLGCGAGFDCFLAAREVGKNGRVIGVDMTPEMIEKARRNAQESDVSNVEFRLGEIEHLPVADATIDVILSNCVINLSPDKPQVFREAFRVLRPSGRVAVSDVVQTAEFPSEIKRDPESLASCVAGASRISQLESDLSAAGFVDVSIQPKQASEEFIREWDDARDLSEYIVAAEIEATKPVA